MCKPHWRQYTNALRKASVARKAAESTPEPEPEVLAEADFPIPRKGRRAKAEGEVAEAIAG